MASQQSIGAEIWQNGERIISLFGPQDEITKEIHLYASIYALDGPIKVFYRENDILKTWREFLG